MSVYPADISFHSHQRTCQNLHSVILDNAGRYLYKLFVCAYFHKQIYFFLNQWDDLIAGSDQLRQSDDFPESIYQFFLIFGN